jgi:hypothetical protein
MKARIDPREPKIFERALIFLTLALEVSIGISQMMVICTISDKCPKPRFGPI